MWRDELVEETRRVREAYAAKFDFDLEAICRDLKEKEQQSERPTVTLPPKPPIRLAVNKSIKVNSR